MRRIYIHLLAIVIASFAAWLTWELVLRDRVAQPPAPAHGSGSANDAPPSTTPDAGSATAPGSNG